MWVRTAWERAVRREGNGGGAPAPILRLVSRCYGLGVRLRGWCLERGILAVHRLPRPVISVGNLTVGGTGKTPLVIQIAQLLRETGHTSVILSRGYARRSRVPVQIVSDGMRVLCGVEEAGDEPLMMAHRLPGTGVWVGADRHRVGLMAWEAAHPDCFLLDDGFQHRRLHRDLEVVVLRAPLPLGNGWLLPAGPLREPPDALERADLVIVNTSGDPANGEGAVARIGRLVPSAPVLRARYRPQGLWEVGGDRSLPLDILEGRRVALVCGVGNPLGFEMLIEQSGAKVARSLLFPDHYWYTQADVDRIRQLLRDAEAVVTTEKDRWKLRMAGLVSESVWSLRVDLEVEDRDLLRQHLERTLCAA